MESGGIHRSREGDAPSGVSIFDVIAIAWLYRWFVLGMAIAGGLIVAVALLSAADRYTATALVMLPEARSTDGLSAKLKATLGDLPISVSAANSLGQACLDILSSRRVVDAVSEELDLKDRWHLNTRKDVRDRLVGQTSLYLTKGQLLRVSVTDTDARTAADIANAFVRALREIDTEINAGKAGRERRFLDARLAEVEKELKAAEDDLRAFQEEHRLVHVEGGLEATAAVITQLEAEKQAREVRLGVLETIYAAGNPELEALRAELRGFDDKIRELSESGVTRSAAGDERQQWLFPAVERVPALALKQLDLQRRLKLQSTLFELLAAQRELARVAEARETSAIQVLDAAEAPERPEPKNIITKSFIGMFAGLALALTLLAIKSSYQAYRKASAGNDLSSR